MRESMWWLGVAVAVQSWETGVWADAKRCGWLTSSTDLNVPDVWLKEDNDTGMQDLLLPLTGLRSFLREGGGDQGRCRIDRHQLRDCLQLYGSFTIRNLSLQTTPNHPTFNISFNLNVTTCFPDAPTHAQAPRFLTRLPGFARLFPNLTHLPLNKCLSPKTSTQNYDSLELDRSNIRVCRYRASVVEDSDRLEEERNALWPLLEWWLTEGCWLWVVLATATALAGLGCAVGALRKHESARRLAQEIKLVGLVKDMAGVLVKMRVPSSILKGYADRRDLPPDFYDALVASDKEFLRCPGTKKTQYLFDFWGHGKALGLRKGKEPLFNLNLLLEYGKIVKLGLVKIATEAAEDDLQYLTLDPAIKTQSVLPKDKKNRASNVTTAHSSSGVSTKYANEETETEAARPSTQKKTSSPAKKTDVVKKIVQKKTRPTTSAQPSVATGRSRATHVSAVPTGDVDDPTVTVTTEHFPTAQQEDP